MGNNRFFSVILAVIIIALIGFLAYVGYSLRWEQNDREGMPEQTGVCTVLEHRYQAPYTSFILAGKVLVPIYHPAAYYLGVQVENRTDIPLVSSDFYSSVADGERLYVHYQVGRSDRLYITSFGR